MSFNIAITQKYRYKFDIEIYFPFIKINYILKTESWNLVDSEIIIRNMEIIYTICVFSESCW